MSSAPRSFGGSQETFTELQVVPPMPTLDGGSGGEAVCKVSCSDFDVMINVLAEPLSFDPVPKNTVDFMQKICQRFLSNSAALLSFAMNHLL